MARPPNCPMGGPHCPDSICDCFVDHCPECAAGQCSGIHPEFFTIIQPRGNDHEQPH